MDRPRAHASHAAGSGIETSPEAATPQWIWAAKRATVAIPIVFPVAVDPVGSGFVDNLSRTLTRRALRMERTCQFREGNKALAGLLKRKVPLKPRPASGRLF